MSGSVDVDALVEYLVSALVEHPDDVRIEKRDEGEIAIYDVAVHPDDVGKLIGRQGRVIKAVRTLVRAAASSVGHDATVEIVG